MTDPKTFYTKKLKMYDTARESLTEAIRNLTRLQIHEMNAPGCDPEEIDNLEKTVKKLVTARYFTMIMIDAVEPLT